MMPRCKTCYADSPSGGRKFCQECYDWAFENVDKHFKDCPLVRPETSISYYRVYEWIAQNHFPDTLKVANIIKYGPMPTEGR